MAFLRGIARSALVAAGLLAVCASGAPAQNYDGNHQVRFGTYLLGGRASGDATITHGGSTFDAAHSHGIFGLGVSGGLEWIRRGAWSWGVEVDGAALWGNASVPHTAGPAATTEISYDYLATVRGRAGLYLHRDFLWYGTVGVGFLGTEAKTGANKVSSTQSGLVAGTGFEYDTGGALIFAEYLYAGFGEIDASTATTNYVYDANLHTFRVGVKFKVGHDWYHDDVAERIGRTLK